MAAGRARVEISNTRHHRESSAFRRVVVELGRRLRELRRERGWTVEKAAERYGVEPAHVRRVEAGRTNPSLATLVSIARALALELADLLDDLPVRGARHSSPARSPRQPAPAPAPRPLAPVPPSRRGARVAAKASRVVLPRGPRPKS
ncbi:MAG: helix-turn-helix transcriptional regulator [Polyangiaceae bacterium]